jgi:hypothetical protein
MYQALGQALKDKNPTVSAQALALADSIFKNTSYAEQR